MVDEKKPLLEHLAEVEHYYELVKENLINLDLNEADGWCIPLTEAVEKLQEKIQHLHKRMKKRDKT